MSIQQSVVITGGNSGLGYACAEHLAKTRAWYVVLAVRNLEKGEQAVKRLQDKTGHSQICALALDLSLLASIRHFADVLLATDLPPLKGLVNKLMLS